MLVVILGIFSYSYVAARRSVKNDPLKGRIDGLSDDLNRYLVLFKDSKPSLMTTALSRFSLSIAAYSFILVGVCIVMLPKEAHSIIVPFISALFIICITLHLAIQWNQAHRETIKKIYKNPPTIILLLAPALVYLHDILLKTNFYTIIFENFGNSLDINGLWSNQFFWATFAILFMYVGFWAISVPIYFILYSTIFILSLLIKTLHKHIDTNVADALAAILAAVIYIMNKFGW